MKRRDIDLHQFYKVDSRYPKKSYLCIFFDIIDIGYANAFVLYTKYIKDRFPHDARLKTQKKIKHNVVMY